jgi:adenylate kinase family enzyme
MPHRMMIMGPSGSGKSTLARTLAAKLDLTVVHMDVLFWQPGWVESVEATFRRKIEAAARGERWVIDGNYSRHVDLRLPRADMLIWLDFPRRVYFPRTDLMASLPPHVQAVTLRSPKEVAAFVAQLQYEVAASR